MNNNILNPKLYKKAKRKADEVYKRHSAYKSMYIQSEYKRLGGKYKNKKPTGGVGRWISEQWVQVLPYLKSNKKIACGSNNKKNKVCRPLKRIDKNTPITIPELLKLHSKKDLIKLAEKKNKNMDGRVFWKSLKFYPSKKK
jgi:hypothetical protein